MFNKTIKVLLVGTSLAPVFLSLAYLRFQADQPLKAIAWLLAAITLALLGRLVLGAARRYLGRVKFSVASATTADKEVMGFLLAYVMPLLFAGAAGAIFDAGAAILLLALFAFVVWGTHSYDVNPVLGMFGFHFYEVTGPGSITYVLITKKHLVNVNQITEVVQLTEYVLLDVD